MNRSPSGRPGFFCSRLRIATLDADQKVESTGPTIITSPFGRCRSCCEGAVVSDWARSGGGLQVLTRLAGCSRQMFNGLRAIPAGAGNHYIAESKAEAKGPADGGELRQAAV